MKVFFREELRLRIAGDSVFLCPRMLLLGQGESGTPCPDDTGDSRAVSGFADPERCPPTEDHDGVLFGGVETIHHAEGPEND